MKLEFHAHLSHLGFYGVYPIYWIKRKQARHKYKHIGNMHAQGFRNPKKIEFGQNTKEFKKA